MLIIHLYYVLLVSFSLNVYWCPAWSVVFLTCQTISSLLRPDFLVNPTDCSEDEYRCRSNECVPANYTCDYLPDCSDNSDETEGCK